MITARKERHEMNNFITKHRRWKLTVSILSLSVLTVMAGAAVAPALNLIQDYFQGSDPLFVQMIISIPALFIVLTNMFFETLCRKFRIRSLLLTGLILYTAGGCIAGIFSNIFLILLCRALVGIGVGIIMPLSTGLIAFYFTRDKQGRLMGYSSAMNMLGGVVASLIAGTLATFSWRLSFLVYLIGLLSICLCIAWMPDERIYDPKETVKKNRIFKRYYPFAVAIFLLMVTFFIYPTNFAIETAKTGMIPQKYFAVIMAMMDGMGFTGGLVYVHVRKHMRGAVRFLAPVSFLAGYLLLRFSGGWAEILAGSCIVGFANGVGVPYIISTASMKAGKSMGTIIMSMITAAVYSAQFLTPAIVSGLGVLTDAIGAGQSPYSAAILISVLLIAWSCTVKEK